ncbi:MAG: NADH dehydrogenase subunit [Porphyromonadaceae bacterium]|nr:MAG: NADH dehydrogenase subunit [Porphyromonadaceae bacterium]
MPMQEPSYIELLPNGGPVGLKAIPVLKYSDFSSQMAGMMSLETVHCVLYYAFPYNGGLKFIAVLADDTSGKFLVFSHEQNSRITTLDSLTPQIPALHLFEREIHENFGIGFDNHPWLKPVRFANDRHRKDLGMNDYPFYRIDSEELHEVGVGPIHAGVIEPGHFRFICNGEKVIHLEIQLGYQHRGIEKLMLEAKSGLTRSVLAENIAGDTAVGHAVTNAQLIESLAGITISDSLQVERAIALELERIAVHIGDTAALCADVAYQFGQVVNEALRTTIINTTQLWCGNRFGKGLIRPGGTHYPLTSPVIESMLNTLNDTGFRFREITDNIFTAPSLLIRFDGIGIVTRNQALSIGAVGMAARMTGIARDIRTTHPTGHYSVLKYEPIIQETGDVLARAMLRNLEACKSIEMVTDRASALLATCHLQPATDNRQPITDNYLQPSSFALSVTEGWRGEIAHAAITGPYGEIVHYKIKDPSFHNWMALALAVRNQEISDFPVCNKSFNLSYCGHDL